MVRVKEETVFSYPQVDNLVDIVLQDIEEKIDAISTKNHRLSIKDIHQILDSERQNSRRLLNQAIERLKRMK